MGEEIQLSFLSGCSLKTLHDGPSCSVCPLIGNNDDICCLEPISENLPGLIFRSQLFEQCGFNDCYFNLEFGTLVSINYNAMNFPEIENDEIYLDGKWGICLDVTKIPSLTPMLN